jgi:hypothetical protein
MAVQPTRDRAGQPGEAGKKATLGALGYLHPVRSGVGLSEEGAAVRCDNLAVLIEGSV